MYKPATFVSVAKTTDCPRPLRGSTQAIQYSCWLYGSWLALTKTENLLAHKTPPRCWEQALNSSLPTHTFTMWGRSPNTGSNLMKQQVSTLFSRIQVHGRHVYNHAYVLSGQRKQVIHLHSPDGTCYQLKLSHTCDSVSQ